ncbi:MAG TPA: hypothetical protein DEQ09_09780 [Bacteroidales bacterium]|nr:hypothetical protein [Bacteroidales bacterium]
MRIKKLFITGILFLTVSLYCISQVSSDSIFRYIQMREYSTASELCEILLQENSSKPEIWLYHGMSMQGMQEYARALGSYIKAVQDESYFQPAGYRLAECYEFLGDVRQALNMYNTLLETDSLNLYTLQQKGRLLMKLNVYSKAEECYKRLLSGSPDNYLFNKNIGICYYKTSRESLAAKHLVTAWLNNKLDLSLPVSIANAYARLKMPDNALSFLKDGLSIDSTNIPILKTAGSIEFSLGNDEEVVYYLRKAYNYGDTGVFINKYLGISYFNLSHFEEAIPFLRRYYSYDTLNTEASYYLGHALSTWHKKEEGIALLQKTIDLSYPEPQFIGSIYAVMAVAKADMNKREDAIEYYNKALELDPGRSSYYYEIAKLYDAKGKIEKDSGPYKKAIEYFNLFLDIEEKKLEIIMKERNLDPDQISAPGIEYAKKRIKEIREELFFRGELEK